MAIDCLAAGLQSIHDEVIVDVALVIADKPVNYNGLASFTLKELSSLTRDFIQTRRPDVSSTEAMDAISRVEKVFQDCDVDMLSFAGIEPEGASASAYYEREKSVQKTVFSVFFEQIRSSMRKMRETPVESRLQQVWYEELVRKDAADRAYLDIEMEGISQLYRQKFETESVLEKETIIESLARARMASDLGDSMICPFWYTTTSRRRGAWRLNESAVLQGR